MKLKTDNFLVYGQYSPAKPPPPINDKIPRNFIVVFFNLYHELNYCQCASIFISVLYEMH